MCPQLLGPFCGVRGIGLLFNSVEYFVFFGVVALLHFLLPQRWRWVLLLVASYAFYMSWNPAYIVLIGGSTLVDYCVALRLEKTQAQSRRRALLLCSLVANLGLLFTFKYWNFFQDSIVKAASWLGFAVEPSLLHVLLPVGISFYTFQTLSYTIDVYRGNITAERHLGRFALFVSFFPQLVAGPIERASRFLPQIELEKRFDRERVFSGLQLLMWGLFKKVVIADRLAIYVDQVYGNVGSHDATAYLLATYAFAFQIYCDFSGYTDMALGSAKVLGFDLMKNFKRPYFATSIQEFWRRWHISLSTWLRDYLYISIGGNRKGLPRTYANLLITMLIGGLWHGAAWNFVVWGAVHGLLLSGSRYTLPWRDSLYANFHVPGWLRDGLRMLITFHLVCFAWVFFRAASTADAFQILSGLGGSWGPIQADRSLLAPAVLGVVLLLLVQMGQARWGSFRDMIRTWPAPIRWAVWYTLALLIYMFGAGPGQRFIYFQF